MKKWGIPIIIVLLSLLSLLSLKSFAQDLLPPQSFFFLMGLIIFFVTSQISFHQIKQLATPFYWLVIGLLVISLIYGQVTGQTGRWIPLLGIFNAQPSQLAILATTLKLIQFQSQKSLTQLKNLLLALGIIILPAILILIEPDLGTTLVYLLSTGSIIFISQVSSRQLASLAGLAILVAIGGWFLFLKPYQKARITSFLNPAEQTQQASYNAHQALIAVGSGQLVGRGLGHGVQSHLKFLPEFQTDFIFAAIAEEFGFIGSIAVLGLYGLLLGLMIFTATTITDLSQLAYTSAVLVMLATHIMVNIGMNVGLLPITGLTLPFLSYGGSSILSISLMLGIFQQINLNLVSKSRLHLS